MKSEWAIWKNLFTPEECDSIIERAYQNEFEDSTVGNAKYGNQKINDDYRRSKIQWMGRDRFEDVFDKLWKHTIDVNQEYFGVHIDFLPSLQFTEYDVSYDGEFKHHNDMIWMTDNNRHRKLSCVIHLTDPSEFEGCELNMNCESGDFPNHVKTKGTVVWFPAMKTHWVTPITKGRRNSVVCWFEGPKWR